MGSPTSSCAWCRSHITPSANHLRSVFVLSRRRTATQYDRMVVTPMAPGVNVQQTQVTEENEDFEDRSRYHQSTVQPSKPLLADD